MASDLSLRRTIIAGETPPDDYTVMWDGLAIGRIFKTIAVGGGATWSWSCALPNVPQSSQHRGRADRLESAKTAFKTAWTDLHGQISHRQIQDARDIQSQSRARYR
jgi:hypothetical protein